MCAIKMSTDGRSCLVPLGLALCSVVLVVVGVSGSCSSSFAGVWGSLLDWGLPLHVQVGASACRAPVRHCLTPWCC